jgi:hypothetical protein
MSIGFFVSGTVLCVFLRGAGIVGTRTQDVSHDSRYDEKERDLSVMPSLNETPATILSQRVPFVINDTPRDT